MGTLKGSIKDGVGRAAEKAGLYRFRISKQAVVVTFHRVNDQLPEDGLTCSSERFSKFCDFFLRHFRVVRLSEQVEACHRGISIGGTLSITFDDGYRDNYEVAAPILKRYNLPATFFLTTGFIGSSRVPQWDLDLSPHPGWMTWPQVRELSTNGFDVGAHTVNHIDMGGASADEIRRELQDSKAKLESEIGAAVPLFAYPFGGPGHITPAAVELVREAGFSCCVSCFGGVNAETPDPYAIKRIGISAWFATPHQFGLELMLGRC